MYVLLLTALLCMWLITVCKYGNSKLNVLVQSVDVIGKLHACIADSVEGLLPHFLLRLN